MKHDLTLLSAAQAAERIREGRLTSEALVSAYLARIDATEPNLKAWAWLDRDGALAQAKEADRIRRAGRATGALHGIPVGLKDIVDTREGPTERGTSVFAGREAGRDARFVERLREAGAVIMGKTKTTECAYLRPTDTTNPHDPARTPGGSSSGSAAAVGARQVPLAVGSQTGGSVIRPASFCGTYGFKPTRGVISRSGVFRTSLSLDQMGVFANTLEDAALLTDVLGCHDQDDPASFARPRPAMLAGARAEAPVPPDFAWFDFPFNDRLHEDAREGLDAVIETLGARVERLPVSPKFAALADVHKTIYDVEIAQNLGELVAGHGAALGPELHAAIERAGKISAAEYEDALEVKESADAFFASHFNDFDAIIAPSATGEAPLLSEGTTGDAIFCVIWTLAGLPCLSIPALVGENSQPVGLQLIGASEQDDRLLRTAAWMQGALADAIQEEEA